MKISRTSRSRQREIAEQKKATTRAETGSSFIEILNAEHDVEPDFFKSIEEIDEYARRLKESPVFENLRRYKQAVRAALQQMIKGSYVVDEQTFYDHHGRRRLYMLVQNVDQKLEELTKQFLSQQLSGLDLVSRLDEIRGMLLDLYS